MHYVFGDYSLDTQRYELRHTGELIPLGPQVFNVLAYLVAHCDRVVSHDELFARLWPDQFVTDDALGRCIRAARRALQDRPEDGMLTTVPARASLRRRLRLAVRDPCCRSPCPWCQENSSASLRGFARRCSLGNTNR
jgi:hypothetical protein